MSLSLDNIQVAFSILFSTAATIIAILTYLKARKNLLQPMKTAVVNKQTELFIEIVQFFKNVFLSKERLMYEEIIALTIYDYLIKSGCEFQKQEEIEKTLSDYIVGHLPNANNLDSLKSKIQKIKPFDEIIKINNEKDENEDKNYFRENFQDGKIDLLMVHLGKTHSEIMKEIGRFLNHPLIPDKILILINDVSDNIYKNIMEKVTLVIEEYLKDFHNMSPNTINIGGINNEFLKVRIKNEEIIERIVFEIREYLRVDEEW